MRIERRLTIDELAERLALPRTTIYYWVRDLPIPGSSGSGGVWPEAARRKGTRAMQQKYRLLREEAYGQGERESEVLAAESTFRDFVCLYVAEGSKRNRNSVAICNSDWVVIRMATRWIRRLSDNSLPSRFNTTSIRTWASYAPFGATRSMSSRAQSSYCASRTAIS